MWWEGINNGDCFNQNGNWSIRLFVYLQVSIIKISKKKSSWSRTYMAQWMHWLTKYRNKKCNAHCDMHYCYLCRDAGLLNNVAMLWSAYHCVHMALLVCVLCQPVHSSAARFSFENLFLWRLIDRQATLHHSCHSAWLKQSPLLIPSPHNASVWLFLYML